jgi:hypothetical protein
MLLSGSLQIISILLITATLDDSHGHLLRTGVPKQLQSPLCSALPHINSFSANQMDSPRTEEFNYSINQPSLRVQLSVVMQSQRPFPGPGYVLLSDALSTFISDDEATISPSTCLCYDRQ